MRKIRIAVLVSGGGTNLQALMDAQTSGILHSGEIVRVISNKPGVYALTRAQNAGIPSAVVSKKDLGSQEAFEAGIQSQLADCEADLIVLAGFMAILSEKFTKAWDHRIINIHPALIPSFCGKGMYGLNPHIAALEKGVKVTGATVHFVNEIPDGGEIIDQKAVQVEEGDTPEILQRRVMEQAEWIILPRAVEKVSAALAKEIPSQETADN
ncbi:MAG: phosphoribosylglycinamide formyltransferase [Eubacteriales bacterium]